MPIGVPENVQQWFEAQNFEVRLFPENAVKKFKTVNSLHEFLLAEVEYWHSFDTAISGRFGEALASVKRAVNPNISDREFQNHLNTALHILRQPAWDDSNGRCLVFSKTKLAKELKVVSEKYDANGYRIFLQGVLLRRLTVGNLRGTDKSTYFALFDAYIYEHLSDSVTKQLETGSTALAEIQSKFNVFFDQCDEQRSSRQQQFDDFSREYLDWNSKSEAAFNERTSSQLQAQQLQFEDQNSDWQKRIADWEELYQKKLMLAAPVEYWKDLAKRYSTVGHWFAGITVLSIGMMVCVLGQVLYKWPPKFLESETWDWNTLKGSFLLLTIASLAIYVVRFLAKFAVSSYHLARDAEERKQLTYVYLSLLEKKAVTAEQQQIVLQALFSRADTGLLKGDHGPTMPSVLASLVEK